jgi:hypothetical protein
MTYQPLDKCMQFFYLAFDSIAVALGGIESKNYNTQPIDTPIVQAQKHCVLP